MDKINKIEQKIIKMPKKYTNFGLFITLFGGTNIVFSVLITLFLLFLITKNILMLKICLLSFSVIISNNLLKIYFAKPRPKSNYSKRFKTYSFPSGHSSSSMIIYMSLAYLLTKLDILNPIVNFVLAITLILTIGWSRVYLKAHYLVDVLAGFGVGFLGFCMSLFFVY